MIPRMVFLRLFRQCYDDIIASCSFCASEQKARKTGAFSVLVKNHVCSSPISHSEYTPYSAGSFTFTQAKGQAGLGTYEYRYRYYSSFHFFPRYFQRLYQLYIMLQIRKIIGSVVSFRKFNNNVRFDPELVNFVSLRCKIFSNRDLISGPIVPDRINILYDSFSE